jgi:hypothetical protein
MGGTNIAEPQPSTFLDASNIPPRRQSLMPSAFALGDHLHPSLLTPTGLEPRDRSRSPYWNGSIDSDIMQPEYLPPPLSVSPRRPSSPHDPIAPLKRLSPPEAPTIAHSERTQTGNHSRNNSNETTSWLDTIDESGGSSASSLHSRHSSFGAHRKRIPVKTGATQAELTAALDAAVEAAYDDVSDITEQEQFDVDLEVGTVSKTRRNLERARQKVREAEREDLMLEQRRLQDEKATRKRENSVELDYLDNEAEEEERLLEEMTRSYGMDDFEFGIQSKSALPHQSDSSVLSDKTWGSVNSTQTAATSIAGLADGLQNGPYPKVPPTHPPPAGALPIPPTSNTDSPLPPAPSLPPPRPPSFGTSAGPGVRDRRLSGQNAKQLKIETHSRPPSGSASKKNLPTSTQAPLLEQQSTPSTGTASIPPTKTNPLSRPPVPQITQAPPLTPMTSVHSGSSMQSESPATPGLTRTLTQEGDEPISASPARFNNKSSISSTSLRKNVSSSSLKMRNLSVAMADATDMSPLTPGSATFSINADQRKGVMASTPVMPTPTGNSFTVNGLPAGGMYLFDDQICSPTTPSTPGTAVVNAPVPLEPCPESFLLRPFWLMRCLYQTIAHPRGGYLSTKLFVPRDVWRVKNVKIKGVEDKVSNCDLLTAALLKLARVDALDADAVLEEMQTFETVLEQVRVVLQKKLGSEVGVQSSAALFKASAATDDSGSQADAPSGKSGNTGNKSYLSSWRKLRSKSSGAGLTASYTLPPKDGNKDSLSMSSLPMTSTPSHRPHKRNVSQLQLTGPNAHYMGALARLFDAVQILGKQQASIQRIHVSSANLIDRPNSPSSRGSWLEVFFEDARWP